MPVQRLRLPLLAAEPPGYAFPARDWKRDFTKVVAYSYFQVNRPRGTGARPCAPTTDVVQIDENCCKLTRIGIAMPLREIYLYQGFRELV